MAWCQIRAQAFVPKDGRSFCPMLPRLNRTSSNDCGSGGSCGGIRALKGANPPARTQENHANQAKKMTRCHEGSMNLFQETRRKGRAASRNSQQEKARILLLKRGPKQRGFLLATTGTRSWNGTAGTHAADFGVGREGEAAAANLQASVANQTRKRRPRLLLSGNFAAGCPEKDYPRRAP